MNFLEGFSPKAKRIWWATTIGGFIFACYVVDSTARTGVASYMVQSLYYTVCWPRCDWPPF